MRAIIKYLQKKDMCYVYLVTELNGITDNVAKIERQKSSTKFYKNNNKKNNNSYLNLHKTIPVITVEEQNSWSQNKVLKY